jgi:hypothetical protein
MATELLQNLHVPHSTILGSLYWSQQRRKETHNAKDILEEVVATPSTAFDISSKSEQLIKIAKQLLFPSWLDVQIKPYEKGGEAAIWTGTIEEHSPYRVIAATQLVEVVGNSTHKLGFVEIEYDHNGRRVLWNFIRNRKLFALRNPNHTVVFGRTVTLNTRDIEREEIINYAIHPLLRRIEVTGLI